jgi:hypothetical protein
MEWNGSNTLKAPSGSPEGEGKKEEKKTKNEKQDKHGNT